LLLVSTTGIFWLRENPKSCKVFCAKEADENINTSNIRIGFLSIILFRGLKQQMYYK